MRKQVAAHMYFIEKTKWKALDFYAGNWWIKGEEYNLSNKNLKAGYSTPSFEADNAEKALRLMGIKYEKVKFSTSSQYVSDILFHFLLRQ